MSGIPAGWYCGCGHPNGINLSECAACGRRPGGPENPIEVFHVGSVVSPAEVVLFAEQCRSIREGNPNAFYAHVDRFCRQVVGVPAPRVAIDVTFHCGDCGYTRPAQATSPADVHITHIEKLLADMQAGARHE